MRWFTLETSVVQLTEVVGGAAGARKVFEL